MTVHAAKGLEFPVVILCDPTAPLERERAVALRRSRAQRLGRVARRLRAGRAARARGRGAAARPRGGRAARLRRGDARARPARRAGRRRRGAPRSWLAAARAGRLPDARSRAPRAGARLPALRRRQRRRAPARASRPAPTECVAPGRHAPRAGTHAVVWWDPRALELGKRRSAAACASAQILAGRRGRRDRRRERARPRRVAGTRERRPRRRRAPTLVVPSRDRGARKLARSAATASSIARRPDVERAGRPRGKRFGTLVHAMLAAVDLARRRRPRPRVGREPGAPRRRDAARSPRRSSPCVAALAHPLMRPRGGAARELRREVPVVDRRAATTVDRGRRRPRVPEEAGVDRRRLQDRRRERPTTSPGRALRRRDRRGDRRPDRSGTAARLRGRLHFPPLRSASRRLLP